MAYQAGDRVGVIIGADSDTKTVRHMGEGVYEGDLTVGEHGKPNQLGGIPNPRIKLDSGKYVWGFQVWWGPALKVADQIEEYCKHGWTIEKLDHLPGVQ